MMLKGKSTVVAPQTKANRKCSLLVNIWNNSYFPAYKSRLGWMDGGANSNPGSPAGTPGADKRKPYSRSSSSQNSVPRSSSSQNVKKA